MRLVSQVTKYFFMFVILGLIFLLMGIYAFYHILFIDSTNLGLLLAGAGCFFVGISFLWQMIKSSPKTVRQNKLDICPFCGAILEKDATFCRKCEKKLSE